MKKLDVNNVSMDDFRIGNMVMGNCYGAKFAGVVVAKDYVTRSIRIWSPDNYSLYDGDIDDICLDDFDEGYSCLYV